MLMVNAALLGWIGYELHKLRTDMHDVVWQIRSDSRLTRQKVYGPTDAEKALEDIDRRRKSASQPGRPEETSATKR